MNGIIIHSPLLVKALQERRIPYLSGNILSNKRYKGPPILHLPVGVCVILQV